MSHLGKHRKRQNRFDLLTFCFCAVVGAVHFIFTFKESGLICWDNNDELEYIPHSGEIKLKENM